MSKIVGTEDADTLLGGIASDTIYGGDGKDVLWGGPGDAADYLHGGYDDDFLNGGGGDDWLWGDANNDELKGYAGNDVLNGGTGNDLMDGGIGDDTYYFDNVYDRVTGDDSGYDTVYSTAKELDLTIDHAFQIEKGVLLTKDGGLLIGNAQGNLLIGGAGDDEIRGGAGDDMIDGGAGADVMRGGSGADTYIVDNYDDGVDEVSDGAAGDKSIDTIKVMSPMTFSLADKYQVAGDVENLVYAGSGGFGVDLSGNNLDNLIDASKSWSSVLNGGSGNDTLVGGVGEDKLLGGIGDDLMSGGKGSDYYEINSIKDKVVELANEGTNDTIGTWGPKLTLGANIEHGTGLSTMISYQITGNELGNTLTGNAKNDSLYGMKGKDVLIGNAGNDTLDGGKDADIMQGGTGNDLYYVDNIDDQVIELTGVASGVDTVRSYLTSYTLSENVENLTALLSKDFTGYGNKLSNQIEGEDGNDSLFGMDGNDTLIGGFGNDKLYGGKNDDVLNGGQGADFMHGGDGFDFVDYKDANGSLYIDLAKQTVGGAGGGGDTIASIEGVFGSNYSDWVVGSSSNETIYGRGGNDLLVGSAGADSFYGDDGIDAINYEYSNEMVHIDLASGKGSGGYAQGDKLVGVENVIGSGFNDKIVGNASDNVFVGGAGADRLYGGAGKDTINGGDHNDDIRGDEGNDILYGDAGKDVLRGGEGNDLLYGGADKDTFVFEKSIGHDTVKDFQDGVDMLKFVGVSESDIHIGSSAEGALITFEGSDHSIVLSGIDAAKVTSADFLFA